MIYQYALVAISLCLCLFNIAGAFSPTLRSTELMGSKTVKNNFLSATQLHLSSDDDFMASLKSRMDEVQDLELKCPLVVLDSLLPRQVMKIQVKNALLTNLVRIQMKKETPTFGMLGMAILNTGEKINLTTGVEVEMIEKPIFEDDAVALVLKARRRFQIVGDVENAKQGWTEARIEYLDSEDEEEKELGGKDRMAVARAMMKAKELTTPNAIMDNNASLVDRWIELAKENERKPGQIDELLADLGEIPSEDEPTERAFWVGALINPLPAMGVAMEIRPALLTATTAERRVEVARDAIVKSIRHMDGSAPMW